MNTRREFIQQTTALTSALALTKKVRGADSADGDWYARPMRWMQLAFVEDDPGQYDPAFWLDYFHRVHADAACLSAGGCVAFYPTKVPFHYRSKYLGDTDPFGEMTAGCRKLGMNVIARTDPHAAHQDVFDAHPEWIAVDAEGKMRRHWADPTLWVTCALGSYNFGFMTDVTIEIVRTYKVDGIFSNRWSGSGMCYCQSCQSLFHDYSGHQLPRTTNPRDPVRRQYILWRQQRLFDLWRLWDTEIKKINPHAAFLANAAGARSAISTWPHRQSRSHFIRRSPGASRPDARMGQRQERQRVRRDDGQQTDCGHRQRGPRGGLSMEGFRADRRRDSPLAGGWRGAQSAPVDHQIQRQTDRQRWLPVVEEFYGWHYRNEKYLRNEKSLAEVAIVYSQQTAAYYGGAEAAAKVENPCARLLPGARRGARSLRHGARLIAGRGTHRTVTAY